MVNRKLEQNEKALALLNVLFPYNSVTGFNDLVQDATVWQEFALAFIEATPFDHGKVSTLHVNISAKLVNALKDAQTWHRDVYGVAGDAMARLHRNIEAAKVYGNTEPHSAEWYAELDAFADELAD